MSTRPDDALPEREIGLAAAELAAAEAHARNTPVQLGR